MDQYERESQLRFFSNVDFSDGCWNWTAGIDSQKKPYGRFYYRGRTMRAHVWSYNYFHADKKDGYLICHHCDNPRCVNPWHLFQGTNRENIYDAIEKNRVPQLTEPPKHLHKDYKTHCKWGHEFTEENTYYVVSTNKSLSCNLGSNSQGKAMTNYESRLC